MHVDAVLPEHNAASGFGPHGHTGEAGTATVMAVGDVAGAEVVPDDAQATAVMITEALGGVCHTGQVGGWQQRAAQQSVEKGGHVLRGGHDRARGPPL